MTEETQITVAASRIFDVLYGGREWRDRLDRSTLLESSDWAQAMAYARAALSSEEQSISPSEASAGNSGLDTPSSPSSAEAQNVRLVELLKAARRELEDHRINLSEAHLYATEGDVHRLNVEIDGFLTTLKDTSNEG